MNDTCQECGALLGQTHSTGCDLVLYGEVETGAPVTPDDCDPDAE